MKIILSGGWGYGNLGDDALLQASIQIIRDKYPESNITILSYDKKMTFDVIKNCKSVNVENDIYEKVFGSALDRFNRKTSLLYKNAITSRLFDVFKRIKNRIKAESYLKHTTQFQKIHAEEIERLNQLFVHADLYIMSGGGYLNDWIECAIVKHQECLVAKSKGVKIIMMGQTLGPFGKFSKSKLIISSICNMAMKGFFRDYKSILETNDKQKFSESSIPDLALYKCNLNKTKENKITLIGVFSYANIEFFNDIQKLCYNRQMRVEILTTQLWESALKGAVDNYTFLRKKGCPVSIAIPNTYRELQELLSHSSIVISENLHGLILGYRTGAKVISLNAGRKYKSFMDLIGQSAAIIDCTSYKSGVLLNMVDEYVEYNSNYDKFGYCIKEEFNKILE